MKPQPPRAGSQEPFPGRTPQTSGPARGCDSAVNQGCTPALRVYPTASDAPPRSRQLALPRPLLPDSLISLQDGALPWHAGAVTETRAFRIVWGNYTEHRAAPSGNVCGAPNRNAGPVGEQPVTLALGGGSEPGLELGLRGNSPSVSQKTRGLHVFTGGILSLGTEGKAQGPAPFCAGQR